MNGILQLLINSLSIFNRKNEKKNYSFIDQENQSNSNNVAKKINEELLVGRIINFSENKFTIETFSKTHDFNLIKSLNKTGAKSLKNIKLNEIVAFELSNSPNDSNTDQVWFSDALNKYVRIIIYTDFYKHQIWEAINNSIKTVGSQILEEKVEFMLFRTGPSMMIYQEFNFADNVQLGDVFNFCFSHFPVEFKVLEFKLKSGKWFGGYRGNLTLRESPGNFAAVIE